MRTFLQTLAMEENTSTQNNKPIKTSVVMWVMRYLTSSGHSSDDIILSLTSLALSVAPPPPSPAASRRRTTSRPPRCLVLCWRAPTRRPLDPVGSCERPPRSLGRRRHLCYFTVEIKLEKFMIFSSFHIS